MTNDERKAIKRSIIDGDTEVLFPDACAQLLVEVEGLKHLIGKVLDWGIGYTYDPSGDKERDELVEELETAKGGGDE